MQPDVICLFPITWKKILIVTKEFCRTVKKKVVKKLFGIPLLAELLLAHFKQKFARYLVTIFALGAEK